MTQLTHKAFVFAVPDDLLSPSYSIERSISSLMNGNGEEDEFVIRHTQKKCGSPRGKITIKIPPGTWRFLFTTKTATEEDARKVVAWFQIFTNTGYYNYMSPTPYRYFERWEESLNSLLRSKGLDDKNNYALIENESDDR